MMSDINETMNDENIVEPEEKIEESYSAGGCGPECTTKRHAVKRLFSDSDEMHAEKQMLQVGVLAFLLILGALAALYFGFFRTIPDFGARYGTYLIYITVSVVTAGVGIWHVKAYRHTFNCSLGMMAGMTIGMIVGFLFGAIIGATNGMFTGSVFGMFLGMFTGAWCTRNCGVMSVMEGLMAGLMGGLMGAMTTVMMLNDNLAIFMPLLIGSVVVITGGMTVMIYKESAEHHQNIKKSDAYEMFSFVSLLFILAILTTLVMVFGPKSALLAVY